MATTTPGPSSAYPNKGRASATSYFGYRRREHCRALVVAGTAAAEGFDRRLRLPALEDVDAAGVEQVGGDGKVEATTCLATLFDDAHAARKIGIALLGFDHDASCDDDHGCASSLTSSCRAGPAPHNLLDTASARNSSAGRSPTRCSGVRYGRGSARRDEPGDPPPAAPSRQPFATAEISSPSAVSPLNSQKKAPPRPCSATYAIFPAMVSGVSKLHHSLPQ